MKTSQVTKKHFLQWQKERYKDLNYYAQIASILFSVIHHCIWKLLNLKIIQFEGSKVVKMLNRSKIE